MTRPSRMDSPSALRPVFLRLLTLILLVFGLLNLLLIAVGTTLPAQLFSFTRAESVGFEKQYKLYMSDIRAGLSLKLSDQAVSCCPIWSPDQNYIAFSGGGGETFVWDRRDGSTRSLGRVSFGGAIADWSPDSRSIIETVMGFNERGGLYDIYRVDVDTAEQIKLTTFDNAFIYDADWSPDGTFIVFMAGIGDQQLIYRVGPDGTNLQQLAVALGTTLSPRVSPDSQRILYASARDGITGLYTMNADGTNPQELAWIEITGANVAAPEWSPDSTHVLYQTVQRSTGVYPNVNLMSAALDGSLPPIQLASHAAITGMPFCWLPDGRTVLYEVDSPGSAEINRIDQDGSNAHTLLQVNLPVYLNLACQ